MSKKADILNFIVEQLRTIDGTEDTRGFISYGPYTYLSKVEPGNVYKNFIYLDHVNDFPTLTLSLGPESRQYLGGGVKYGTIELALRGYVRSTSEDVLNVADDLLQDIEHIVEVIAVLGCEHDIEECRIISLGTDEGLYDPFCVVEVTILIRYLV